MERETGDRRLVVGLGNPILGDDGVGIQVVRALRALSHPPASVDFEEACVGGLGLIEMMVGYEQAIVIDAYQGPLLNVGEIRSWSLDELRDMGPVQPGASPHDTSLYTAYDALQAMGAPLPSKVTIFAVGAVEVDTFSTELTPSVRNAVPRVRDLVLEELMRTAV